MKFGIFYEHQLPRPWHERSEYELFQNSLSQIELADSLGYDYAWEVEHHFLEEYSHSSAPEVFLAAASQRTKQIRLGHGIVQITTNHPARVAERVSTLDLLSGGRVELGLGEGSNITELHPFDRRYRDKRAVWEDAVRCIIPMFTSEGWEYHGDWFDFPLRNVLPKPLQKPHPPLWVACSQLDTLAMAGQRGMGALGFQFLSSDAAHAWVNAYYNNFVKRQEKLTEYATNPNIALVCGFMCAETDEEALQSGRLDVLPVRSAVLQPVRKTSSARHREPLGGIPGLEGVRVRPEGQGHGSGGLARNVAPETAEVRDFEHRPGDPAQPGGQELARGHLREPGPLRPRSDAGVPRTGARAPRVETESACR